MENSTSNQRRNEAEECFYSDYFYKEFFDFQKYFSGFYLNPNQSQTRLAKNFFESYPQFKPEDFQKGTLQKIKTLETIIQKVNIILSQKNKTREDIDKAHNLLNDAYQLKIRPGFYDGSTEYYLNDVVGNILGLAWMDDLSREKKEKLKQNFISRLEKTIQKENVHDYRSVTKEDLKRIVRMASIADWSDIKFIKALKMECYKVGASEEYKKWLEELSQDQEVIKIYDELREQAI